VIRWAQNSSLKSYDSLISPLATADTISKYVRISLICLGSLPERKTKSQDELDLILGDIEAFAMIGNYYAEKIRAACSLALYNFYGLRQDQDYAVQHLENAVSYWKKYADIYSSQYKPALFSRIGYINIPDLIIKAEEDINIAKNWKPGTIKEYKKGRIINP
jgi:hypothetical protein